MLQVRKLYIDSRFATKGNSSKFEVDLGESLTLPKDTVAYITSALIPCAWDTVDESNRNFYILERSSASTFKGRIVQLTVGPHDSESLRNNLETVLNGPNKIVSGNYTVTRVSASSNASGGAAYRYLSIGLSGSGSSGTFVVPSQENLQDAMWYAAWATVYNGMPYNTQHPHSTNELFSFSGADTYDTVHLSSFVDLRSKHSVYIHSPSFGSYSSLGPKGNRTILAKIPVDQSYGSLIKYHASGFSHDYIEIGAGAVRTLQFELRDAYGELLNMQGSNWSMTILFAERPR